MNPKSTGFEFDEQQMVYDAAWDEVLSNLMKKGDARDSNGKCFRPQYKLDAVVLLCVLTESRSFETGYHVFQSFDPSRDPNWIRRSGHYGTQLSLDLVGQ